MRNFCFRFFDKRREMMNNKYRVNIYVYNINEYLCINTYQINIIYNFEQFTNHNIIS